MEEKNSDSLWVSNRTDESRVIQITENSPVFKILHKPNIFIYGLSGSGKDTIANYLRDSHCYLKLRLAKTIKQIISETKNIPFEEFDILKRTQDLRQAHWDVSKELQNKNEEEKQPLHSLNRLNQLIDGTSIDYEILPKIWELPKVICDVRTKYEANALIEAGWKGIFLSRTTNDFCGDGSHYTEQNMFFNGELLGMIKSNPDKFENFNIVLNNDKFINDVKKSHTDLNIIKLVNDTPEVDLEKILYICNGETEHLLETVELIIKKYTK